MFCMRHKCAMAVLSVITLLVIGLTICMVSRRYSKRQVVSESVVVVDSDGGVDDLQALLMLLRADNVVVKAVTTVQGNTGVTNATRNIQTLLAMLNKTLSVAVYPGRDKTDKVLEKGYYGWDGLGDFLPPASLLDANRPSAGEILATIVSQNPGEVTVLCLGPLTNIAEALKYEPYLLNKANRVIIIGASYKGGGNVGRGLEFNMATDPNAASFVFNKASPKNPVLLIPLETIESDASFPRSWREKIGENETRMIDFFNKAESESLIKDKQWICYDQTGAAAVISPEAVLQTICGRLNIGSTGAASLTPMTQKNSPVHVVTALSNQHLKKLLIEALLS